MTRLIRPDDLLRPASKFFFRRESPSDSEIPKPFPAAIQRVTVLAARRNDASQVDAAKKVSGRGVDSVRNLLVILEGSPEGESRSGDVLLRAKTRSRNPGSLKTR